MPIRRPSSSPWGRGRPLGAILEGVDRRTGGLPFHTPSKDGGPSVSRPLVPCIAHRSFLVCLSCRGIAVLAELFGRALAEALCGLSQGIIEAFLGAQPPWGNLGEELKKSESPSRGGCSQIIPFWRPLPSSPPPRPERPPSVAGRFGAFPWGGPYCCWGRFRGPLRAL